MRMIRFSTCYFYASQFLITESTNWGNLLSSVLSGCGYHTTPQGLLTAMSRLVPVYETINRVMISDIHSVQSRNRKKYDEHEAAGYYNKMKLRKIELFL